MPVATDNTKVNANTTPSRRISLTPGRLSKVRCFRPDSANLASIKPAVAPSRESKILSVRSCLINLRLGAPSDVLIANSRSRDFIRTSMRLATFAPVMSNTRPTTPKRIQSVGRIFASRSGCSSLVPRARSRHKLRMQTDAVLPDLLTCSALRYCLTVNRSDQVLKRLGYPDTGPCPSRARID